MRKDARIYIAGHRGLVGSALVRRLEAEGYTNLLLRTRAELDLADRAATRSFFREHRPQYVFVAAAKVGGILANSQAPVEFLEENLRIEVNVIGGAHEAGVQRLLFLGSSCIYPKNAPQPVKEKDLLTGSLEPTNQWYAVAKIAGVKLCDAYRQQYGDDFFSAMPTNLYGPGDNFDLRTSHVLPALIRKFHEARSKGTPEVVVWGTGTPRREFLHVDDLADACVFLMKNYRDDGIINVGVGEDIRIAELAELIREVVGYGGQIAYDISMPDGTPRKLLDTSRLSALGWRPQIGLRQGIQQTYAWFRAHEDAVDWESMEAGG